MTTPSAGSRLGPYEILAPLGAGGMGEVYRARDTRLGREVAIKVLPAALASDPERLVRFEREARSASALSHPNIVAIYDVGSVDQVSYIAMELVSGAPLRALLGAALPVRRLLQIAVQIAEGLAKAHDAGIVHRDLKPENVMVTEDGLVKILDFGLAKLTQESGATAAANTQDATLVAETAPGIVMGTVGYMSPEQAMGRTVDHRSDQFSLGAILYEMATGRRAFERGSAPETLTAVIREEPEAIVERNPSVPAPVRWTIERCLIKEPRHRYASTEDLARELATLRDRVGEVSGAIAVAAEPVASSRRQRWLLPLSVAAAMLLTAGVAWWRWGRADDSWRNPLAGARYTRVTDWEGAEIGGSISADGKFVAFLSDRDGPYDVWVQQLGSGEFLNVTKGRVPGLGVRPIRLTGFTDDGSHVWWPASIPDNGAVWQAPTMGGALRPFPGRGRFLDMQLSPDRGKLLFMENATPGDPIFVGDAQGNNAEQIYINLPGWHSHFPTWSADGRFVYFAGGPTPTEMDVWRVPARSGEPERLTQQSSVRHLTRLGARTLLYAADRDDGLGAGLWALDLERRVSFPVSSGIEAFTSVAASGDGRRLVATVANSSRNLWSVPIAAHTVGESEVQRVEVGSVHAGGPRFGPGYVVYLSTRGGPNGLRKLENGADVELWEGRSGVVEAPAAISADGARICFAARRAQRWQLYMMAGDGSGARPIAESLDVLGGPTMSPDGRWIAAVVAEAGMTPLYKIPVDGGAPVRLVESSDGVVSQPLWSPDGKLIAHAVSKGAQGTHIRAVTPEGEPFSLPDVEVLPFGAVYRFLPDSSALVVLKGVGVFAYSVRNGDFWLVDLSSGETRQLTEMMKPGYDIGAFDVSPDGTQIIFDRYRENSDIVLIDLPAAGSDGRR